MKKFMNEKMLAKIANIYKSIQVELPVKRWPLIGCKILRNYLSFEFLVVFYREIAAVLTPIYNGVGCLVVNENVQPSNKFRDLWSFMLLLNFHLANIIVDFLFMM
jgi:hypothetical protein